MNFKINDKMLSKNSHIDFGVAFVFELLFQLILWLDFLLE